MRFSHVLPGRQVKCQVTGLIALALCSLVCATFLLWLTKRCLDVTGWQQRLDGKMTGKMGKGQMMVDDLTAS